MNSTPPFAAHHRAADDKWQTVLSHLLGVAQFSMRFANKLKLGKLGELVGLLHDLGKYSLAFQTYLKSAIGALNQDEDEDWVDAARLKGKVDHSSAGAQLAWQALSGQGDMAFVAGQVAALCVASHHSGLIDCIAADEARFGEDGFTKRMGKPGEKTHLDEARKAADPAVLERCAALLADPGLVDELTFVLRDVAKKNRVVGTGSQATFQQLGLVVRFLFSCLIDADRTDTANFEHPRNERFRPSGEYPDWLTLRQRLEQHLASMPPKRAIDGLRREISEHCRQAATRPNGIYTLTVPTGGGKKDHLAAFGAALPSRRRGPPTAPRARRRGRLAPGRALQNTRCARRVRWRRHRRRRQLDRPRRRAMHPSAGPAHRAPHRSPARHERVRCSARPHMRPTPAHGCRWRNTDRSA